MKVDEDQIIKEDVVLDEQQVEEEVIENAETLDQPENEDPDTARNEEEEDRIVIIGDSPSEDERETPGWVKKVRKVNRKLESENKRLKRQLEEKSIETVKPVELGEKPTLASCKYDDSKYEKELIGFYEQKRKVEDQAAEKVKVIESQNKVWQNRQEQYVSLKKEHNFKDFDEMEETVSATFSQTQQGIIVQGAEDAALLVYALGKNPKKLEELAKITDPVDFAFKVAKLESQLKITSKKVPEPEKRVSTSTSGGLSGNTDKVLDKLRSEADKSGDYTKIAAYKRKLRNKDN